MNWKQTLPNLIKTYTILLIGSIIAAFGLEEFLIPNQIIDGGIVGVSIILSHLTSPSFALYIILLNIPFLYLGYLQIGRSFAFATIFSVSSLAYWTTVFRPMQNITYDLFLAAIFGGIMVGVGVGLIIRYGGSLDGTEIVAIILAKKSGFSVGEFIMFMNLFIFACAGFVFGWEKAMYSMVAYFVAFKTIDITVEGLDESKGVMIVTDYPTDIAETLLYRLGRGVTILHGEGGYSGNPKKVLYSVITRLEIAKLKAIVVEKDPQAFVTIHEVHDVMGGRVKKNAIH
jgi:uncharacterized membrane-anchored protein YitT (DUF2179 family)